MIKSSLFCLALSVSFLIVSFLPIQAQAQQQLTSEIVTRMANHAHQVLISQDKKRLEAFFEKYTKDRLVVTLKTFEDSYKLSEKRLKKDDMEGFAKDLAGPMSVRRQFLGRDTKSAGGIFEINAYRSNEAMADISIEDDDLLSDITVESYATECAFQIKIGGDKTPRFIRIECESKRG